MYCIVLYIDWIPTGYWLVIQGSIPGSARFSSLLHRFQTDCGAYPAYSPGKLAEA
jgi:hypothetical protein